MQPYLEKFDNIYKGSKSLEIEIFDEEPLTKKFARYNQGGTVCSCMENSNTATLKTKEGFQKIQCDKVNCQYRQKNEQGKMTCNRIGCLKFLMPQICTDRVWIMRITSQKSIDRLDDYFNFKKIQGKSLKGKYTLFLKQEQQYNYLGKSFNNYVLDIFDKADFISENTNSQTTQNHKLQTENEKNINNNVKDKTVTNIKGQKQPDITKNDNTETKKTTNKNNENEIKNQTNENATNEIDYDNCYILVNTYNEKNKNKLGEDVNYLIGVFHNMSDDEFKIAINPKDAPELLKCDIGTVVTLDIKTVGKRLFALNIEYVDKKLKNKVA